MKRIILLMLSLLLCCSLVLTGCQKESGTLTKVRLSEVTHSIFYAPLYAAINLGMFEEAGIEIELTNAGGADKAMAALLSESTDIAFMGPEATVYVALEGRADQPVVIGQLTQKDGAFLVSREENPDFTWDDLKGKYVIGGRKGGVPEMTLEYVLRSKGIDPKTDLEIDTGVQFAMMGGAFLGGLGDYVTLFEPTATEVEALGLGHIVASVGAEGGNVPYTCFQVTKSFLNTNADLVERFMEVIYDAQQWVATHSDMEVAEAILPSFPDTALNTAASVVGRYRSIDAWSYDPIMTEESYNRLLDIMEQAGELSGRPEYSKVIDNSVAQKVVNGK